MDGLKLLTLSGWTQPADALSGIAPNAEALDYVHHTPESLMQHRGEYDIVIGWSLGGVLARQLLKANAISAKALVSIAAPFQFVRGEHLHEAMSEETFEQFYANYRDEPQRTKARFHGLVAKGDTKSKDIRGQLSHHPQVEKTAQWLPWMDYLRDYSAEHHDYSGLPKTLLVHGSQDAIVPFAQAKILEDKIGAELVVLPNAGHAPHLHDAKLIREAIAEFIA